LLLSFLLLRCQRDELLHGRYLREGGAESAVKDIHAIGLSAKKATHDLFSELCG
jgi:hypothetical protein